MRHRRRARLAPLALAALAAGVATGAAGAQPPVPAASVTFAAPQPTRALWLQELDATQRRRAQAQRLARSRTVPGALRRALLLGAIDQREHDSYRHLWWRARLAAQRLGGRRGAELGAVIAQARSLAARRMLGPRRIAGTMLTVRRNLDVWSARPFPAPGADVAFRRDERVYRYIPGQGVQLHPLASFGVANALARRCIGTPSKCRKRRLRRLLEQMIEVSSWRAGYRAWEYRYAFAQGRPPWVSGMAQGTGVQAFARGAVALHDRRYLDIARSALGAFTHRPPTGVSTGTGDRRRYVMYSFAPDMHILNGELQAIAGLHDLWVMSGDRRAGMLWTRGERGVRASIPSYDTGAWSLYSQGGAEANLHYHRFTTVELRGLCRRTKQPAYCRAKHRFRAYQRQAPHIGIGLVRGARVGRASRISFSTSKVGRVWVRVDGPGGRSLDRMFQLPRGRHLVLWVPPRRGRYVVRVDARGLSGPVGTRAQAVQVRLPRPTPARRRGAAGNAKVGAR